MLLLHARANICIDVAPSVARTPQQEACRRDDNGTGDKVVDSMFIIRSFLKILIYGKCLRFSTMLHEVDYHPEDHHHHEYHTQHYHKEGS